MEVDDDDDTILRVANDCCVDEIVDTGIPCSLNLRCIISDCNILFVGDNDRLLL